MLLANCCNNHSSALLDINFFHYVGIDLSKFVYAKNQVMPITETHHVRLQTLILIRWIAVSGQFISIMIVHFLLAFSLPFVPLLATVALSAVVIFAATVLKRTDTRVSNREAAIYLSYDIIQLSFLIALTGGLENPFAILLLVPAAISATILDFRSTAAITALVIFCATLIAFFHQPLPWLEDVLHLPKLYLLALWISLVLATLLITAYAWQIANEARRMANALSATQMALSREQSLSAVGSLAAATAHQLGTPLATIAVVSRELERDLPEESPHLEDAGLLVSEVERCRKILGSLMALGEGEENTPYERIPISGLAEIAAAPHRQDNSSIKILVKATKNNSSPEPTVPRRAEILHGLNNVIENAVQFCSQQVDISVTWNERKIKIEISDDGPGVTPSILVRLGEPYVSSRRKSGRMGLGVFIAKTLLERTGATMLFLNGQPLGARIVISWPRRMLEDLSIERLKV